MPTKTRPIDATIDAASMAKALGPIVAAVVERVLRESLAGVRAGPGSPELPAVGFIRQRQILEIIPICPTQLWHWVKTGNFPKPVKLSAHTTAWRVEEVRAWMERAGTMIPEKAEGR